MQRTVLLILSPAFIVMEAMAQPLDYRYRLVYDVQTADRPCIPDLSLDWPLELKLK